MGFLMNPYMLLGALAAAIPLILHLVYRRRAPRVLFSTLRFIKLSIERTARRRKIRELILLLLRTGAILFLALGLADWIFRTGAGSERNVSLAVVMDNSYSMSAQFEGRWHFARARDYATEILRDAAGSGQAALFYAWPPPHGKEYPELTADLNRLADEIQASDVSIVPRGDLAGTVARAEELLKSAPSDLREIYVFTDMQRLAWRPLPPPAGRQAATKSVPIIVVDCGGTRGETLAVTDVRAVTSRQGVGMPLALEVQVQNYSPSEKDAGVTLYLDRQKRATRAVTVGANSVAVASFIQKIESAGTHTGWLDLEIDDAVAVDNRRYFAFDVPEKIRVALVKEKDGPLPLLDDAYFISAALNPATATQGVLSTIVPAVLRREQLADRSLADFSAVFLLNLPELADSQLNALKAYLHNGGAVVIFVGDNVKAETWNALSDSVEGGLLPARLGEVMIPNEETGEQLTVAEMDETHPMFTPFRGMPSTFLTRVRVWRHLDLQVEENSRAKVLSRLSNGQPFLVEKEVGSQARAGRVLLFCTTANDAWTNLPTRNFYLSMLHQMVYYLAQTRSRAANYIAGSKAVFPSAAGQPPLVQVTNPRNTITRAEIIEGTNEAIYSDTNITGPYDWHDVNEPSRSGVFAVNIEPSESDLTLISHDDLSENVLKDRKVYFARDAKSALAVAARLRKGFSLRNPLLFLVLAILIGECVLANRARRRPAGGHKLPGQPTTGLPAAE